MEENKQPLEDEKPHIVENSTIFSENTQTDDNGQKKKKSKGYGKTIALLTTVCVVVAAAIACTVTFWKVPDDKTSTTTNTNQGIVLIKGNTVVDTVKVKNPNSEYTFKKSVQTVTETTTAKDTTTAAPSEQTFYLIQGYDGYNMDKEATTALVNEMLPLTASQRVTGEWTDAELGLDNPIITVNIDKTVLSIGKSSGMGDMHYCKISGDNNRYLLSDELCADLMQTPKDFVKLEAIPALNATDYPKAFENGTLVGFDYIHISGKQFPKQIKIKTLFDSGDIASFAVTEPKSFYADMSMVSAIISPFSNGFTATGCYELVTEKTDFGKYGLDAPQYVFEYSFEGKKFKIALSKAGVVEDGVYAVRINDGNVIYKFPVDSVEFLFDNVDDLRSTVLFSFMIKDVDIFTVKYGNVTRQYDIGVVEAKDDNGNLTQKTTVKTMDGKELDAESFQNIYLALANISPSSYTESGAELSQTPYMTITLKMTSGKVNTVKFIKYNDRYYRMYVNDIGDQLINYSFVERLAGYFDDFAAGKKIASPSEYD